jgi:low temperature requirement protein LtrA
VRANRDSLLRDGGPDARPIELFFDLVYVLAVIQLTHHLIEHLTLRGAAETLVLGLAVWAAWSGTTWGTNFFEPNAAPVRLALLGLTLVSLVMSASIPDAFGDRGLAFALAYIGLTSGRHLLMVIAVGRDHRLAGAFARPLAWWAVSGALFLAGALASADLRLALWAAAVVLEYTAVTVGYPVPGHGHTRTLEYTISGEHMAERCQLFVLIALGESILVTGGQFGDLPGSAATVAAFVVAFVSTAAFWWIYFDRGAGLAREVIARAPDPGRLGLIAYTYAHIPMVAGVIVVAAADELTLAHPTDDVDTATAATILLGPALFLAGAALFKRALWGAWSRVRTGALVALAALVPLAFVSSALVLATAATAVVVAVAWADTVRARAGSSASTATRG